MQLSQDEFCHPPTKRMDLSLDIHLYWLSTSFRFSSKGIVEDITSHNRSLFNSGRLKDAAEGLFMLLASLL